MGWLSRRVFWHLNGMFAVRVMAAPEDMRSDGIV